MRAEMPNGGLNPPLDHHLLDFGNCLGWVQTLRAGLRAVHDRVAAIKAERILEVVEALALASSLESISQR